MHRQFVKYIKYNKQRGLIVLTSEISSWRCRKTAKCSEHLKFTFSWWECLLFLSTLLLLSLGDSMLQLYIHVADPPLLTRPTPCLQLEGFPRKTTFNLTPIVVLDRRHYRKATNNKLCYVSCRKAARRVSESSTGFFHYAHN